MTGPWIPPPERPGHHRVAAGPPGLPGSPSPFPGPGLPGPPSPFPGAGPAGSLPPPPAAEVVAVCSGKGGVGKSTVALNLAAALAADGYRVGLLDADVHAPDIPLMVGLARRVPATQWVLARRGGLARTKLEPVDRYGIRLMSTGFLFGEDQPVAWTADLVQALLNQLIWSTTWGELDYLLIDLPPGTSDITQAIVRLLPSASAVLVVTPQDVAHLDTRRVLAMLGQARVTVLGGVENMSWLSCPCCDTRIEVFPRVSPERSVWATGLPLLASVPLEPAGPAAHPDDGRSGDGWSGDARSGDGWSGDARSGDGRSGDGRSGDGRSADVEPVVVSRPDSARARALRAAAAAVRTALAARKESDGEAAAC
jgi:ATP-binding protein involved in chromosome partitioning